MTAGIQIFNSNDGKTLVLGDKETYAFRQSGRTTVSALSDGVKDGSGHGLNIQYGTLPRVRKAVLNVSATDPILAIKPVSNDVVCYAALKKINSTTYEVNLFSTTQTSVDWWVFDKPYNQSSSYGLHVYNESSQLMFTSDQKPATFISNTNVSSFSVYNEESYITNSSNVAIVIGSHGLRWYPTSEGHSYNGYEFLVGTTGIIKKTGGLYGKQMFFGYLIEEYMPVYTPRDVRFNQVRIP